VPAWAIWLIGAAILAGAELLSLDLVLIMVAAAAALAAGSAALGLPVAGQIAVFGVSALALLLVVRPIARRHLDSPHEITTGTAALVGRKAVVVAPVDAHAGQVRLAGEVWSARSYDETQVLEVGRTVDVMSISGATAVVWGGP